MVWQGAQTRTSPSPRRVGWRGAAVTALLAVSVPTAKASYPLTTDAQCSCFQTSGSTSDYFSHHSFFDFRSLTSQVAVPPVLMDKEANAKASATNSYFTSSAWTDAWKLQSWSKDAGSSDSTVPMVNSPNNVYIERNNDGESDTYLTMRTARTNDFQSAAEIESASTSYQFLSVRMRARTVGSPGAVTALFTYRPPTDTAGTTVQEADLEILTSGPSTKVQLTNQPSQLASGATQNQTMPGVSGCWNEWATYRIDWTPGATTWYVDGKLAATIKVQAPRDPSLVILNSWSDGGSWSGVMANNGAAYLQIQWLEMVFNNTDAAYGSPTGGCKNVCSIDETPKTGTPVLLNGPGGDGGSRSGGGASSSSTPTKASTSPPAKASTSPPAKESTSALSKSATSPPVKPTTSTSSHLSTTRHASSTSQTASMSSPTSVSSTTSVSSNPYQNCQAPKYAQCGGKNWGGCTGCVAGSTCQFQNDYFSQCQ